MTVYAVAQLRFTDRTAYDRYQAAFMEVFARYSGTLLAADDAPRVIEGEWTGDKVVLMSFPDEAEFRRWADSPEYQQISVDRRAGTDTVVLLVHGIAASIRNR
ncbi:DUF1330 domain-containing protein [Mycolicibacterium monacense]|uniref:DUF1330 domain-containing protein n=1 Tax=Mycolicibacterium monacense TaxID=85693 RepID=A0AAD1IY45_MYCMB|nr:DUF1330 domain-containing protein [Mycolicibacterium monacense]MDA4100269.1 hypothetical protein [Mycolicibacterium monacense DSM 44395]ORB22404.1 hypothetical protein BST34_07085 [Mycolicibacterium monacense DSM 44395]QHP84561.1 DUF1330 domain-containing protein [Mycolicibacterium monacense DSM 44395]BBZ62673.1 hypothetical protein MMON_39740 [Mycolicibacterium monacense]